MALPSLLADHYREWRKLDPTYALMDIAGDSAWDENWACECCLMDYGVHPIFRLHNERGYQAVSDKYSRDGSVAGITSKGQLVCAAHGAQLTHLGLEGIKRDGLEPGQRQPGTPRVRGACPHGCGKLGLKINADHSKLLHHPHFDDGGRRSHLHAYRDARLHTLNLIESYHNRLKSGFKLGTEGPDRTRLRDLEVVTALIELADLFMVAATVWDVRNQLGIPMQLAVPAISRAEAMRRAGRRAA
jgi:hypothetical protein